MTLVGTVDDLTSDLLAVRDDCLLVGDGAIRYADDLTAMPGIEIADLGLAFPSARSLVQLAHARALREEWIQPRDLAPLYLRKPDAEINWSTREGVS